MDRKPTIANQPESPSDGSTKPQNEVLSMDEVLIKKLDEVIEQNLNNEQFSVEELADAVAMSRSHLHRKLNKIAGRSISQYVRGVRLTRSHELLEKEVGTVSEIAFKVGFGSSSYFIKCFNEEFGYSPGDIKRRKSEEPAIEDIKPVVSAEAEPIKFRMEQLHPAVSEGIIREIFGSMIQFKPSLQKFMMVDEDEGEALDVRMLAYQIFKNYPWPIGVEIRRLFSVGLQSSSEERVSQLEKTILRTLRINFFVLISELILRLENQQLSVTKKQKAELSNCLERIDQAHLISGLSIVIDCLGSENSEFFDGKLPVIFDKAFFRELEDWQSMDRDDDSYSESLEQIVTFLIKKSAFLLEYKFVSVNSIEVLKSKFSSATFKHSIHLLNSTEADFHVHKEILEEFSDSRAVLLMKSIKDSKSYVNLSPFILDTHHLIMDDEVSTPKDTYLFDGFSNGEVRYIGTAITQKADLSSFEDIGILRQECVKIFDLLSE